MADMKLIHGDCIELDEGYFKIATKRIYNPITVYEEDEDSDILETPLFLTYKE